MKKYLLHIRGLYKEILLIIVMSILLFFLEAYIYNVDDILSIIFYKLGVLQFLYYAISLFLTNFLVSICFFIERRIVFFFLLVIMLIPILIDLSYYYTSNYGFGFDELSIAIKENRHILEAISTYYNSFLKSLGIVVVLTIISLAIRYVIEKKRLNTLNVKLVVIFFIMNYMMSYIMISHTIGKIYNPVSFVKIYNNVVYYFNNKLYDGVRDAVKVEVQNIPMYKNIILIVDESVGGKYLSINGYSKETTPFLETIDGSVLTNLGLAVSGANCSNASNIILMSGICSEDIPDQLGNKILKKPNIFQYMKKAGFKTAYISGQSIKTDLQNYMREEDLKCIDYFYQPSVAYTRKSLPKVPEENIIDNLKKFLSTEGNHFVYIVKQGSHVPYEYRYPESSKYFKPTLEYGEEISFSKKERMINSYLNSLRYNVDLFSENFLQEINLSETVVVYTSDHGQSILEQNVLQTHSNTRIVPISQGIVPLFIIHSEEDKMFDGLKRNVFSHFNIFPTLMYFAGYDPNDFCDKTFFNIEDNINYFYSGDIFGRGDSFKKNIVDLN